MTAQTGPYDPWNAAARSAAAAGGSWRADVRPAQSSARLIPGEGEEKPQGEFARLVDGGRITPPSPSAEPPAGAPQGTGGADATGPESGPKGGEDESAWLSVEDLIDVINPFQHIPVVSTVYREFSGDEISPAARIAGGALYFWPFGAASAAGNVLLEAATGDDLGGHVMALLDIGEGGGEGGGGDEDAAAQTAEAAPQAAPQGASQGAPQLAALPADMLEALQGAAVRPLAAEGFAFPQPSKAAGAAQGAGAAGTAGASAPATPDKPRAAAEAEAQAERAAEARALRRSSAEAGGPPPAGSVAGEGGWFSSAMLQALGRYESAQDLGRGQQAGPTVNIEN